ncbi:MAG: TolC family protein, partial [Legionellales bacterium]
MGIHIKELSKTPLVLAYTACMVLSSCTVGPNYSRPETVVSPKFKEAKGSAFSVEQKKCWKPIHPQDAVNRGEWWAVFKDPLLNDLERDLNVYNQNIVNADANYRQAVAIVDEARASYFPILASTLSIFRQKQGGGTTSFISTSGGTTTSGTANTSTTTGPKPTTTTYSSGLNASWEPDIWGLVRRTVESDTATAQADAALIAVTRLSAQGALAQYYFEMRTLDTDQKLLDDTVISYKKALQLTRNQYASGVASQADIVLAQSQLEAAQSQAINNGILRGQYEHAIAVL